MISNTWDKFKTYVRISLGEFTSSVDNIQSKIQRDSQHQLEKVTDWVAHLKYLESILVEFYSDYALVEMLLSQ